MIYELKKGGLTAKVDSLGAQLISLGFVSISTICAPLDFIKRGLFIKKVGK